ncbi:neuropilin and tolloid-like protein 1 [Oppia nitens]|uniref:neuropilin and tolloid-like protein 1 n=1 Tax=Oppia nitens TaxID=1686743 RepID=UPI0023DA03F9|nr:neuropilin and tolloid-like protein 1 [Oppia nitens]
MPSTEKTTYALFKLKRETYKPNMDCNVTIKAPPNYGVIAYVKRVKLRKLYSLEDSLEVISDYNMTSYQWLGTNEELLPKVNVVSSASKGEIYVIFRSENFALSLYSKGFKIILTLFTLVNSNGICGHNSSLRFNCNNKICIDNMLECDGINNCINSFDEQSCSATSESMIGLIVFSLTLLIMAILVIVFLCKTDKQKREDMARRFSKVCINSGRRLSTIFLNERRHATTNSVTLNRLDSNDGSNVYRSVPIVYESNQNKESNQQNVKFVTKIRHSSSDNLNKSNGSNGSTYYNNI